MTQTGIEIPQTQLRGRDVNADTKKSLSFWSIVIIAANTMNGPGLTTLPAISHSAGKLILVALVCLATSLTSYVLKRLCILMWGKHDGQHYHEEEHDHPGAPILEESDFVALSGDAFAHYGKLHQQHGPHSQQIHLHPHHSTISAHQIASIAMVGCALALALAQMMLTAKIGDAMIVASFGSACGVDIVTSRIHCTNNLSMQPFAAPVAAPAVTERKEKVAKNAGGASPLEDTIDVDDDKVMQDHLEHFALEEEKIVPVASAVPTCLFTGGLAIALAITVSLASVDLDSMLTAQYVLFGCLLLACFRFCYTLSYNTGADINTMNEPTNQLFIGSRPLNAVGPVLFNFAFVVTAPPLVCAAQGGIQTAIRALSTACVIMGSLYSVLGWVGASPASLAKEAGEDTNLLSLVLARGGSGSSGEYLSVIVFGVSQLAAIPVYCELARETIDVHFGPQLGISPLTSFLLCHIAPWLICAMTYNSTLFESFIEWSSLLLLGFCNFSLPLLLDIVMKQHIAPVSPSDIGVGHQNIKPIAGGGGRAWIVWVFGTTSATITAVIIQRISESNILAEGTFFLTMITILKYF
jgi:hypothetical protein